MIFIIFKFLSAFLSPHPVHVYFADNSLVNNLSKTLLVKCLRSVPLIVCSVFLCKNND